MLPSCPYHFVGVEATTMLWASIILTMTPPELLAAAIELSPNLGDGLRDQAAAVWDCEDAELAATSIPSVNLTP